MADTRLSQWRRTLVKVVDFPLSWWRRTRSSDVAIGFAVALVGSRLVHLQGDAAVFYPITGGAAVALIAFVVAPVATLLTLAGGARTRAFDRRHRGTIIRAMIWAFGVSVALLALSIGAGLVDNDAAAPLRWLRWMVVGSASGALLATCRLFWFFVAGLAVRDADADRPLLEDRAS